VRLVETDQHVLDNAVWHALSTTHAPFAEVQGTARRYGDDVSVFAAAAALDDSGWADLALLAGPGGGLVLFRGGEIVAPADWTVIGGGTAFQMVLTGPPAEVAVPDGVRPLTDADVPAMLDLVELAKPGPFRPRTIELGGYLGVFRDGDLVAMAGERVRPPGFAEVSAVATHPEARRRGYGAAMTALVSRAVMARGETPFLHVAESNVSAKRVYERLGFTVRRMVTFAALQAPS
jgi:GNAT superfamily N-acetyltransferase